MKTQQIVLILLVLVTLLSGCGQREAIIKDYYLVQASHPQTVAYETPVEGILAVKPFSIGSSYQSRGLVYNIAESQFDTDYYNEYFISPSQMITEQAETWFAASGLFKQVLPPSSLVDPTFVLEGDIRRMYYDLQDSTNIQANLEIVFYLIRRQARRSAEIEFTQRYQAAHTYKEKDYQLGIEAMSACLTDILGKFEKDLAAHLKSGSGNN